MKPDLNLLPHVLVVSDPGDGLEKTWEVEHPDACPVACDWWPGASDYWNGRESNDVLGWLSGPPPEGGDPGHRTCYVQYEVEQIGLGSLAIDAVDGDAHIDPSHVPTSEFEEEWHRLRPGRYVIEGWYHDGHGMGDYGGMGDADGGLTLIGPESSDGKFGDWRDRCSGTGGNYGE